MRCTHVQCKDRHSYPLRLLEHTKVRSDDYLFSSTHEGDGVVGESDLPSQLVKLLTIPTAAKHRLGGLLSTHETGRVVPVAALWVLLDNDVYAATRQMLKFQAEIAQLPWHAIELQAWLIYCGTLNDASFRLAIKREIAQIAFAGLDRHGPVPDTRQIRESGRLWIDTISLVPRETWSDALITNYNRVNEIVQQQRTERAPQRASAAGSVVGADRVSVTSTHPEP
ncbi:uncharacterized protein EV422DRAFT_233686 [Fimicolochytrium jonesii]|uniref:uncharacterized protein n=1 Tax=Fimicolochytrium jonesii TaxID=1396493 RepID=UPI0022FED99D|nr:uncharacterized protein EV422DRAFT_233686 [Fimicolochytrium jonesii]KAI8824795.1 hypothetical protein EV422DRAFT_233686 [Fimicolochytrium jonesii]